MHVDESKKFDKRNTERNIKDGILSLKEYEAYLSRLPDSSDKIFHPEEDRSDSEAYESHSEDEGHYRKKGGRRS